MGYFITVELDDVKISSENIDKCLEAINGMFTPKGLSRGGGGTYCNGKTTKSYSWVGTPKNGFKTLREALNAWRYATEADYSGAIVLTDFIGEKIGDDELLFEAIAPFVEDGGIAYFTGEDSSQWRYLFENGAVTEQQGRVVYE